METLYAHHKRFVAFCLIEIVARCTGANRMNEKPHISVTTELPHKLTHMQLSERNKHAQAHNSIEREISLIFSWSFTAGLFLCVFLLLLQWLRISSVFFLTYDSSCCFFWFSFYICRGARLYWMAETSRENASKKKNAQTQHTYINWNNMIHTDNCEVIDMLRMLQNDFVLRTSFFSLVFD